MTANMTEFRRKILARRERLILKLLWSTNGCAKTHYREVFLKLVSGEYYFDLMAEAA